MRGKCLSLARIRTARILWNREAVSGDNITFEFLRATNKQINKHHINSKTDNNSNLLRVLKHFATIWLGRSTMFEFSFYKFVLLQEQTILVRLWNFDEHFFMFPVLSICLLLVSYLFGRKSFKSCSRGNPPLQALLNWGVMVGNIGVIYLENWSPAGNVSSANYCKNPWPIISSVPDTSSPHFGIHRPKM